MTANVPTPESLNRETSLWAVYRNSRRLKHNWYLVSASVLVFMVDFIYWFKFAPSSSAAVDHFHAVVDESIGFVRSTLGFILAGFTIFLTMTRPGLFLEMAKRAWRGTEFSHLQVALYRFMRVFIHFIFLLIWCFLLKIFVWTGGPGERIAERISGTDFPSVHQCAAALGASTTSALLVYAALLLGSFIFNVYTTVLAGLRWDWQKDLDEQAERRARGWTP